MRKLIITAASIATVAIPTAAMASVAVDSTGTGFVGKGDVQNALGLANDAAMQDQYKNGVIAFTMGTERSLSTRRSGSAAPAPTARPVPSTSVPVAGTAVANINGAGKLTNGWNLTGVTGGAYLGGERTGAPTTLATARRTTRAGAAARPPPARGYSKTYYSGYGYGG